MDILRRNTDYALRLVIDLAGHADGEALSTRVLAEAEDVSYQLACKLMQKLHAAGVVDSDMGAKGGFRLKRSPEEISLVEIIEAIQGPLRLNRCVVNGVCPRQDRCPVRAKIGHLQEQMNDYLRNVTLAELAQTGESGKAKRCGRKK